MVKTPNPSEARVTAMRNPGTGAQSAPESSGPGAAPANAPPAQTEGQVNPDQSGADGAKAWGSDVDNPGDIEVVAAAEEDPRGPVGETLNTPADVAATEGGQQTNPPVQGGPAGLRVKYKGEERVYDEATARNMVQQFLAGQGTAAQMAPINAMAQQIMQRTGITDPAKVVQLLSQGLQALSATRQPGGAPAAPAAPGAPPAAGGGAPAGGQQPMSEEAVNAQLDEMEKLNGLRLPEAMRANLATVLQHAHTLKTAASVLPALQADVNNFKNAESQRTMSAVASAVDTRADAVAKELNLTDDDFPPFQAWVGEQAEFFPGYDATLVQNPDAMEAALRNFAAIHKGSKVESERQALQNTIQNAAARAGGDGMAAPRGGAGAPNRTPTKDFNQEMMDTLK